MVQIKKCGATLTARACRTVLNSPTIAYVVILMLTLTLTLPIIAQTTQWSPIDEQTHIDYAWMLSHGQIPHAGHPLSEYVLRDWACSGQSNVELPSCDSPSLDPEQFPGRGENYNFSQTPLYYLVAGSLARAMTVVMGETNFDVAMRFISALVTALGLALLNSELRRWKVAPAFGFFAAVFVLTLPPVLASASRATPDCAAILSSVISLMILRRVVVEKKFGVTLPLFLTAILTGIKVLSALPVLCVSIVILFESIRGRLSEHRRQAMIVAFSVPLSFLTVYQGWSIYQSRRVPEGWTSPIAGVSGLPIVGAPFREWLSSVFIGTDMISGTWFPGFVDPWMLNLSLAIQLPVCIGLAAFGWLVMEKGSDWRLVGALLTVGALVWPWAVQMQAFVGSGDYFPRPSPRYGMSMLGVLGAVAAMCASGRSIGKQFGAYVGVCYLISFLASTGVLALS